MIVEKENKPVKFLKKYWIILVVLVLAIGGGVSSVEIYKEEVLNIDPDIQYEQQKTLYFAAESMDTLNPLSSQSEDTYYLSKLIYEGLFAFDENLSAVPQLVKDYSVDTQRAMIKITLKNGVTWHDGNSLKAEDVRFTVNAIKAAGRTSPYYDKASKIVSVNVLGARELAIYFRNNYNCSLDDLTFPIVPSSQYASAYQFARATDFKPIGTGKYKFKSYDSLKQLKLSAYKKYYGTKAQNKIEVTIVPDKSLENNLMDIGSVTCYTDDSASRKSIATDKNYSMYDLTSNHVDFMVFNTKNQIFRAKEIRQALAYGINEQKILENAYMGDGVRSDTIYYPNFLGVADEGDAYTYDFEKARTLLEMQGIKDIDEDGTLENSSRQKVTLKLLVDKSNSTRYAAARMIEKNLESLGFKVNLTALKKKDFQTAVKKRDFDLLVVGYTMNESYDLRSFFNGKNEWRYTNSTLLQKVSELERMHTEEEYQEIYKELKTMLSDELPYYPLCYRKMSLIGIETFQAEMLPMFNNIYYGCDTWSWSKVIDESADAETSQAETVSSTTEKEQ